MGTLNPDDTATDPRPAALAALGYQPVYCTLNQDGDWTPQVGTTGRAPFPAAVTEPAVPYRPALRPPPGVQFQDVDDHDGQGAGPATIKKMEAEFGPLPPTWRLTSRGPDQPTGRYLYRGPDDLVITDAVFAAYGGCVEICRTGHRFSWAPGDINPRTRTPVVCYGPDGAPCELPPVSAVPWYPAAWTDYFRRATTYSGGSGEATASASEAMAAWRDPHAEPPAAIAAEILADWPAARHPELKSRALHLAEYAAAGHPGMGTLFGRLAGSFSAETGRDGYAETSSVLTWWLEHPQLWPAARHEAEWEPFMAAVGTTAEAIAARTAAQAQPGQAPAPVAAVPAPPDLLAGIRDGAWLDGQHFPVLNYHVDGLVPEGLTVLTGAPKVGKSWLVLGWALDLARAGRTVIYMALEDSDRRMQSRCRVSLPGKPVPAGFRYITSVPPGAIVAAIAEIVSRYRDGRPLVILDTLGKVMPPAVNGETTYARDYRVMVELKAITDGCPGAGLLVCHHDRKAASGDFIDVVSGTRGITGGADTVLLLTRPRNEPAGVLQITGRDVDEDEYAVTFTAGRWTLDGGTLRAAAGAMVTRRAQAGLGDRSAAIVEYITGRGDKGARTADVAAAFGMSGDAASAYLGRLHEAGRIKRASRGVYMGVGTVGLAAQTPPSPVASQHSQPNQHHPTSVLGAGPPAAPPRDGYPDSMTAEQAALLGLLVCEREHGPGNCPHVPRHERGHG